jgi:predicted kinase
MKLTIMRGVPGSGKSTYAQKLSNDPVKDDLVIVSADNYFTDATTGAYNFDSRRLGEAHKACMKAFFHCIQGCVKHIVVDNTNINIEDMAPYAALGEAMGYDVEIVQLNTNASDAAQRNVHGVPADKVHSMWDRMQRTRIPKRWKVTSV